MPRAKLSSSNNLSADGRRSIIHFLALNYRSQSKRPYDNSTLARDCDRHVCCVFRNLVFQTASRSTLGITP